MKCFCRGSASYRDQLLKGCFAEGAGISEEMLQLLQTTGTASKAAVLHNGRVCRDSTMHCFYKASSLYRDRARTMCSTTMRPRSPWALRRKFFTTHTHVLLGFAELSGQEKRSFSAALHARPAGNLPVQPAHSILVLQLQTHFLHTQTPITLGTGWGGRARELVSEPTCHSWNQLELR